MRRERRAVAALLPALALAILGHGPAALAHTAGPPRPPAVEVQAVEEIPAEDTERYLSRVAGVEAPIDGLETRIVGPQEKIEVTWTGVEPLVVEGYRGEPMLRMSAGGVEVNSRSPSAYLSGDRYAAITVPPQADPDAAPRWSPLESAGPISWYDHRTHWMRAERPPIVGGGDQALTIFHWRVPLRLAGERFAISGNLGWLPEPAEASAGSSPLLKIGILAGIAVLAGAIGIRIGRRFDEPRRRT